MVPTVRPNEPKHPVVPKIIAASYLAKWFKKPRRKKERMVCRPWEFQIKCVQLWSSMWGCTWDWLGYKFIHPK